MSTASQQAGTEPGTDQPATNAGPAQYRIKTNVVEAMQWDGTWDGKEAIKAAFPTMDVCSATLHPPSKTVRAWSIRTGGTSEPIHAGDFILKGHDGSFSTCTAQFFAENYERAWTDASWVDETMRLVELVADAEHANGETVRRVHRQFLREHLRSGSLLLSKHEATLTVDAPNGDKLVAHGSKLDMMTIDRVVKAAAQASRPQAPADWHPDLAGLATQAHGFVKEGMTAWDRENLHDLIDQLAAAARRVAAS